MTDTDIVYQNEQFRVVRRTTKKTQTTAFLHFEVYDGVDALDVPRWKQLWHCDVDWPKDFPPHLASYPCESEAVFKCLAVGLAEALFNKRSVV